MNGKKKTIKIQNMLSNQSFNSHKKKPNENVIYLFV